MYRNIIALFLALSACTELPPEYADFDGDGYAVIDGDCDDEDVDVYPDADEYCDGIDNDCDDNIDENDAVDAETWFRDLDNDDFGDQRHDFESCEQPIGYVANDDDCNDNDATTRPGGPESEYCSNQIDDDCDGRVDWNDSDCN
ncbi:MAG: MopE-related protein [Patescibacteria group bacterium]|jgi:hypothetical protein